MLRTALFYTLVILILICGGAFSFLLSPPFELDKARQIKRGMSKSQVIRLVGEPSKRTDTFWSYSDEKAFGPKRTGWLDVVFDANGLVEHVDIETLSGG